MRGFKIFYSFFFVAILSIPFLFWITGISLPQKTILENRWLAKKPALFPLQPKKINAYVQDNIPFRNQFTYAYLKVWGQKLGRSGKLYTKGSQGHYYLTLSQKAYLGLNPLSKAELHSLKVSLLGKKAFWESYGAKYLAGFIPDKETLYPEFLPKWVKYKYSWYDQLRPVLYSKKLKILDFTPILKKEKVRPLYNKRYDVDHWNGNALDIAYHEIRKQFHLAPVTKGKPYKIVTKKMKHGSFLREKVPWMDMNFSHLVLQKNDYHPQGIPSDPLYMPIVLENKAKAKGTFFLFSDSYFKMTHQTPIAKGETQAFPIAKNVQTYIGAHPKATPFYMLQRIAKEKKPDFVFEAFVERTAKDKIAWLEECAELLIAGERILGTPHRELSPEIKFIAHNATLEKKPGKLVIKATNKNPVLLLPNQKSNEDGHIVMMAKIISPHKTYAEFFYASEKENFIPKRSYRYPTKKGINYIYTIIEVEPNTITRLRLDPGAKEGEYLLLPIPENATLFKEQVKNAL